MSLVRWRGGATNHEHRTRFDSLAAIALCSSTFVFLIAAPILSERRYAHVLVDEVQDFSLEALRLIRVVSPIDAETPDPLCTAGDGHQRIYRTKIPISRAGIDIRGRSRRLKINYHASDQIRKFAQGILTGVEIDDLDGGVSTTGNIAGGSG
ncbi:MAG: UvrD-helicase domain-containing protein [Planctomycetaceae bacterium]